MAGVFPSGETSDASASTRCQAGLSSRALLLECTSSFGPRPHLSPVETNSNSTTPFAPKDMVTVPSSPCADDGVKTPTHLRSAAVTSGRCTICWMCGEPISSSLSQTNTKFTGSLRPEARIAWTAARNAPCGPFELTAPRPTTTFPNPDLSTSVGVNGGDDHSDGSTCLTSYIM